VIRLSDQQLETVMGLARPLPPWQRGLFLEAVARRLAGVEIGDGSVHAAAVAAQREVIVGTPRRSFCEDGANPLDRGSSSATTTNL
jgi:hypothetical protein